jgi:hypothetical protein
MVHAYRPAPAAGHRLPQFADVINLVGGGGGRGAANVLFYFLPGSPGILFPHSEVVVDVAGKQTKVPDS